MAQLLLLLAAFVIVEGCAIGECPVGKCGEVGGCRDTSPGSTCSNCCIAATTCSQSACSAGTYCPGGTREFTCPAGKWSGIGASSCRDCEVGRYGSSTGNNASTCDGPCSAGYYCPAGSTSSTQAPCAAGRYGSSTANNALTCDGPCTAGRYGSSTGNNASTCNGPCSAGYYCPAGSTSSTQNACPAGKFGATSGLQTATCSGDCSAGYYCPLSSTSATQVPCPVGRYREDPGGASVSDCTPCAPGKYSPTSASNSRTFCLDCPKGTYNGTAGASALTDCRSCAAGKYNNLTGRASVSACVDCVPGRYSNLTGAIDVANCTACPKGTFSTIPSASNATYCKKCESNYFSGLDAATACAPCPAGSDSKAPGSVSVTQCRPCAIKYYNPASGGSCNPCPAGQITVGTGSLDCISLLPECELGYTARAPGLEAGLRTTRVSDPEAPGDCIPFDCPSFTVAYGGPTPPLTAEDLTERACRGCPAGSFGAVTGNATFLNFSACAACPNNTLCPGSLLVPLQPADAFRAFVLNRSDAAAGDAGGCVAARTLPAVAVSFATLALTEQIQGISLGSTVGGVVLIIAVVCCCRRGHLRACATPAFSSVEVPSDDMDRNLAERMQLWREGSPLSLLARKRTAYGGACGLFFVLFLLGIWAWYIADFVRNNVEQAAVVTARAFDGDLAPLRWAAPVPAAAGALLPALPPGVNLQLRVFGDARLGCGAPLDLNYEGNAAFEALWAADAPSGRWLLQPRFSTPPPPTWVLEPWRAGSCAAGVSLFTLSCVNCTLNPESYLTFYLPFTCQSFYAEAVSVDALGQVGALALDSRYSSAAPDATAFAPAAAAARLAAGSPAPGAAASAGRMLSHVTWSLATSHSVLVDTTPQVVSGGPARGFTVAFISAVSTTVAPAVDLRGGGVQPMDSAVAVTVKLALQPSQITNTVRPKTTPGALVATLIGLVSLSGVFAAAFFGSKACYRRCAPKAKRRVAVTSAPPATERALAGPYEGGGEGGGEGAAPTAAAAAAAAAAPFSEATAWHANPLRAAPLSQEEALMRLRPAEAASEAETNSLMRAEDGRSARVERSRKDAAKAAVVARAAAAAAAEAAAGAHLEDALAAARLAVGMYRPSGAEWRPAAVAQRDAVNVAWSGRDARAPPGSSALALQQAVRALAENNARLAAGGGAHQV